MSPRVLVIDNYDSFVYNLVQYLGELGADPIVFRNTITPGEVAQLRPDALLISPGPGRPEDAGHAMEILSSVGPSVPTLGVCLGHQCIGALFGAVVDRAPEVVHGKSSVVHHDGEGLLSGLPQDFPAGRYHSLVVKGDGLPPELKLSAWTEDGVVMGLRHRSLPIEGVQFHPESVLTDCGKTLMANFVAVASTAARR